MKNLFKNPFFYINIFLLVLLILLSASINPNSTNLPSFAKKALAAVQSILGEGTVNYLAAFTGANQIGNSIIYDTGTRVGIGVTNPTQKLDVGFSNVSANDYWIRTTGKWASQMRRRVEIIAVHSQTTSIPDCPLGWENLWSGYSLAGSFLSRGYEAFNDLGSSGSCVEAFRPIPFIECSNPTNCDFYTADDYAMWLSTDTVDQPNISGVANILPHISRCSVCKKSAKLVVKHSFSTTVPSCPTGSTALWSGYSLHGAYLGGGYNSSQDLKSPGTCLKEFRPIPVIECSNPTNCDFYTSGDFGMWLSTDTVYQGNITGVANILPHISRCVVCEY